MDIKGLYRLITYLIFTVIALTIVMVMVYNQESKRIEVLRASATPATVAEDAGPVFADEAEEASYNTGKELFRLNCAACHNRNMKDNLTGPALAGVQDRWADYPPEDLYKWIRNSQAMIVEGHPRAQEMWDTWKPVVMTPFLTLTDQDIDAILLYINKES